MITGEENGGRMIVHLHNLIEIIGLITEIGAQGYQRGILESPMAIVIV